MRRALKVLAASVAVIAAAFIVLVWWAGRESALQWLARTAIERSGGTLAMSGVSGSLYGPLSIAELVFEDENRRVTVRDVRLDWSPRALLDREIHVTALTIEEVVSFTKRESRDRDKPASLPDTLRLPFTYRLEPARIETLIVADSRRREQFNNLEFSLDYDGAMHRAVLQSFAFAVGSGGARIAVEDSSPFELEGEAGLSGEWQIHAYRAQLSLSGFLANVNFAAQAASGKASVHAKGIATPFASFPLDEVEVTARGIDPSDFGKTPARADISLDLSLASKGESVSGELIVLNTLPGRVNEQRVPAERIAASFAGSIEALKLNGIEIALHEGGKLVGNGNFDGKALRLGLNARAVDLKALHASLQATQLEGGLQITANTKTQTIDADLTHESFHAAINARHDSGAIVVSRAELASGKSTLAFSGDAALDAPGAFKAEGALRNFDPADFGDFPSARLNAIFRTEGQRDPDLRAELNFTLDESRWRKVSLHGEGAISIAGGIVEKANVELRAGENRLQLDGAFGREGDAMTFTIAAPRLGDLGPKWRGRLDATGILSGSVEHAALDLDLRARNLKFDQYAASELKTRLEGGANLKRIAESSSLELSMRGNGLFAPRVGIKSLQGSGTIRDGLNGKLEIALGADEVKTPRLALNSATINTAGTRASHRISARAMGSDVDFQTAVHGGLSGDTWSGEIESLSNEGRYPIALLAPAKFSLAPSAFHLRGASLDIARGRLALREIAVSEGRVATSGSVTAFPLAYALSLVDQDAIASTDLVAGGEWDLQIADSITGELAIRRESGDVTLDPEAALGLTQLEISARARENRVHTTLAMAGRNAGTINAGAELPLRRIDERWSIARGAPLKANVNLVMPSLAWLGAFVKDEGARFDGALSLTANAHGSLNQPVVDAEITVKNLSASSSKTAIALRQGDLRAALNAESRPGSPDTEVRLSVNAAAPSYGQLTGHAQTRMTSDGRIWGIARDAPLSVTLDSEMPSLAWANALVKKAEFGGAFKLNASAQGSWNRPRISATLEGENLSANSPRHEIELSGGKLHAALNAAGDGSPHAEVTMTLDASATSYGNVSGQARTRATNEGKAWTISPGAPITASLNADMPSLAWTRALLPPGSAIEGSFNARTAASGTWEKPNLSGTIGGDAIEIQHLDSGLNLTGGVLRAELQDSVLRLDRFSLRGGEGTLDLKGSAAFGESNPTAEISFSADRLMALSRPDRLLVLSGGGDLEMRERKFSADVKLRADRALIELPDDRAPALGEDVVVIGETKPKPSTKDALSGVKLALQFDLGDDFIVNGKGLDARLAGLINVSVDGAPPPTATGTIRVIKGSYAAYGQRLEIERGVINFSGPIDNPGLDIVAMRTNQPVEAGVAITGTALNPRLALVSDPVVPDTEKVSWLVLGRGLSGSNQNDLALVQAAAGALLAKGQSVSLQTRIAQATGLDEVGISGSGLEGSVLTLGKRLSSRVYLTFERGLTGASNIAKLRYALTPRWSLETQAGSDTALDLFYTLSFD